MGAILGLTLAIVLLGYDDLAMRLGFELPEWTIAVALLISLFLIPLLATLGFNPALRWTSRLDELHPDEAEWLRECVLGLDPDKPEEQIRKELEEYLKLNPPHWIRSWGTHVYECPSCSALNKENVITAYCWNCKEWIAKAKVVPNPYRVPNGEAKAPAPKQLDSEPKHLVCLECHALNPPSSGYCDECGEELGLASAALPDSTVHA